MNWIQAHLDPQMQWLFGGLLVLLTVSSVIGLLLARVTTGESGRAVVANLNARIHAWWVMAAVFAAALLVGRAGTTVLFGLVSFLALREFITLTPTHKADHRTLFWVFFIFTPLQYYLVAIEWYGLFSILIPVYAFLFLPLRNVLSGDTDQFLARTAKTQWGLMICVYCVSHAPALLTLHIPSFQGQNAKLLLFFVIVVQMSDVLQYVCGKTMGRHKIAPSVSPNKTWEGFVGGVLLATALGAGLWWATPFELWQAALFSLLICLMGFVGGLCMSAIKRDRGVKDFGALLQGHGGMLDRIDSVCFAAPVFFHCVRFFFT